MQIARSDSRVISAALIGSLTEKADRWSDLDLSFGLAKDVDMVTILSDWTSLIQRELGVVVLFDLPYESTMYKVFLLPSNLQVDLSFTPSAEFCALGPKFSLLWGNTSKKIWPSKPSPWNLFGYAVHHLVRARFCMERSRLWQAEYWTSSARDYALSLACLHSGLETSKRRGFDQLPRQILDDYSSSLDSSIDKEQLLGALQNSS